jgi:tetratricopeptide (TPR) repeat protein
LASRMRFTREGKYRPMQCRAKPARDRRGNLTRAAAWVIAGSKGCLGRLLWLLAFAVTTAAHVPAAAQLGGLPAVNLPVTPQEQRSPDAMQKSGGSDEAAEKRDRLALIQQPDSVPILDDLALLLESEGKHLAALYYWKRALDKDPANERVGLSIAALSAELGYSSDALSELRTISAAHPQFEPAFFTLGTVLCRMRNYSDGLEAYRKALQLNPADGAARLSLAKALLSLHHYEDAIPELRQYVTEHPADAEGRYLLGVSCRGSHRLEEAEAELRGALQVDRGFPRLESELGATLTEEGNMEEALPHLDRAISQDRDDVDAHFYRLQVFRSLKRTEETKGEVEVIASLQRKQVESDRVALLRERAKASVDAKHPEDAIDLYREALKVSPHDASLYYEVGVIEGSLGRLAPEQADLKRAETEDPTMAAVHNQLGVSAIQEGNYDEAKRELERAIRREPLYFAAIGNLGVAFARAGDTPKAIACFQRATELNPAYEQGHLNLGVLLAASGSLQAADEELGRALAIDANDQVAAHLRTQIRSPARQ